VTEETMGSFDELSLDELRIALRMAADYIFEVDGDQDRMGPSRLTRAQSITLASLLRTAKGRIT